MKGYKNVGVLLSVVFLLGCANVQAADNPEEADRRVIPVDQMVEKVKVAAVSLAVGVVIGLILKKVDLGKHGETIAYATGALTGGAAGVIAAAEQGSVSDVVDSVILALIRPLRRLPSQSGTESGN